MKSKFGFALAIGALSVCNYASAGIDPSIPSTPGFGFAEDVVHFDGVAYFAGTKATSGSTRSYAFEASNKASEVNDNDGYVSKSKASVSGSTVYPLYFVAADPNKSYQISNGVYELNFKGTSNTATGSGTGTGTVEIWGTGIANPDAAWNAFNTGTGLNLGTYATSQLLFKATLTAFDVFGESTATASDNAIAFKWTNPTGLFAAIADLINFTYLANISTSAFAANNASVATTQALHHTNVPLPAAVYLFGTGLAVLAGRAKFVKRSSASA